MTPALTADDVMIVDGKVLCSACGEPVARANDHGIPFLVCPTCNGGQRNPNVTREDLRP